MDTENMGLPPGIGGPEKKGPGGFRILLYVLLGLGGVLALTCGGAAIYAWRTPAVRQAIDAAMESQDAPGAEELRAAGCAQAGVMDMGAAMQAMLEAEGEEPPGEMPIPTLFITCQRAEEAGLDCDEVARTYIAAVGSAADRFVAQVNAGGLAPKTVCQVVYAADGNRLGTLEEIVRKEAEDADERR